MITLFPHELVCTYTYEVRNVTNLKHMTQMCGSISGMSGVLTFSTEELGRECVTLPFEAHADGESTVVGKFYTFGHHTENPDPHKMVFYVVMDEARSTATRTPTTSTLPSRFTTHPTSARASHHRRTQPARPD